MLKSIGEKVTDDEVDEMILMADVDGTLSARHAACRTGRLADATTPAACPGDGQVSFEEFAKLMLSLASVPQPRSASGAAGLPPGASGLGAPYGAPPYGVAPPHLAGVGSAQSGLYGTGLGLPGGYAGAGAQAAYPGPPPAASGNPVHDMEMFQRMHGLDAEALRRIHRKFQEVDTVREGAAPVARAINLGQRAGAHRHGRH